MSADDEKEFLRAAEQARQESKSSGYAAVLNDAFQHGVMVPVTQEEIDEYGFVEDAITEEEAIDARYSGLDI